MTGQYNGDDEQMKRLVSSRQIGMITVYRELMHNWYLPACVGRWDCSGPTREPNKPLLVGTYRKEH
jgi:hypothetical protein